jgi:hypothetical protein
MYLGVILGGWWCRFYPERFMPPLNEGADEVWTGYQVRACVWALL